MLSSLIRSQMIEKLNKITDDEEKSRLIETSVYDFVNAFIKKFSKTKSITWKKLYIAKLQQVYHLLKKNTYLNFENDNLLNDIPKLSKIAFINYQTLCPAKWNLLEADLKVLDKKITNDGENIYTTDLYKCRICKQNKCVYSEVQVKSCDENCTIFVRCLNCGHSFRG